MNRVFAMMLWVGLLALLAAGTPMARGVDEAVILTALTGANKVRSTGDGLVMTDANGQWIRAVRTVDGGYSLFSTNGGMRLFRTERGYGFTGASNTVRSVVVTPQGFAIHGPGGIQELTKIGSAYIDRAATNNYRIVRTEDGFSAFSGPLAPTPADTAYELFLRRDPSRSLDLNPMTAKTNGAVGPRR